MAELPPRAAIEDRTVYGAFVATPGGPKVLTASAGSPVVAQLLSHAADESGAATVDVVEAGPRAAALGSSVLPLVIAGVLTGIVAALTGAGGLARATRVALASLLTGVLAAVIVQNWLGVVQGEYHWHKHDDLDEFFYCVDGQFLIDLEGRTVALNPRQGFVVPKGVMHRTRAPQKTVILMVEGAGIVPTGD